MNYNSSSNSNSSFIFSQTKTKEIPSALFPIMSTGFNNYSSYPSRDIMTNLNNSLILQSSSPPPIPKYNIDNSLPASNGSFDRLEESDSQKEGHTITNNCSMARLQREAFDSTSGREEWAEEPHHGGENDAGSGSTRLFHGDSAPDQISASNTSHIDDDKLGFDCMSHIDTVVTICLAIVSFASPILMSLLPRFSVFGWTTIICTAACEFTLMFTAFKLCILSIASLVLYCRRQTYSFPRVLILKVVLIMLLFFIIFTFWLFYVLRILMVNDKKSASDYDNIISYCSNVTDILLFLHYLSIVMLEIRHLDSRFCIKIVRSPDGESRFYKVGNISIQAAAIKVLQNYVLDFPMYNIYSRSAHRTSLSKESNPEKSSTKIKVKSNTIHGESLVEKIYVSGGDKDRHSPLRRSTRSLGQSPRGSRHDKFPRSLTQSDIGFSGFKERLYKEMEHEKRLKKRRLRLMASGEDTFNRVKRYSVYEEEGRNWAGNESSAKILTSSEAAQNILAQLAKPFQKYLKLSRMQPHFPKIRIINHLVKCLQFGMSAQAFLENFISTPRVIESSECIHGQVWTVICNKSLCRGLSNNMTFLLKREGVALMCSVYHIPIFSLTEDIYDLESEKFVIKFNSETSV